MGCDARAHPAPPQASGVDGPRAPIAGPPPSDRPLGRILIETEDKE